MPGKGLLLQWGCWGPESVTWGPRCLSSVVGALLRAHSDSNMNGGADRRTGSWCFSSVGGHEGGPRRADAVTSIPDRGGDQGIERQSPSKVDRWNPGLGSAAWAPLCFVPSPQRKPWQNPPKTPATLGQF